MNIGLAQIKPAKNNIEENIANHIFWIRQAVEHKVNLVVFPELSISNYQPDFCVENALQINDKRLTPFQSLANLHGISIAVGLPLKFHKSVKIAMALFQKNKIPHIYYKEFLHTDEFSHFTPGENVMRFPIKNIVPAICYESTIEAHNTSAKKKGAKLYMVSVAKSITGIQRNRKHLQSVAKDFQMAIAHVNYVGDCGDFEAGGQTCFISKEGKVLAMLSSKEEGLLIHEAKLH